MPGIGEIQLLVRFFQDADDIWSALDRLDEGRDVATAERIGEALQIVERKLLIGQGDDEMVEQRRRMPAISSASFGFERSTPVTIGAGRSAGRRDGEPISGMNAADIRSSYFSADEKNSTARRCAFRVVSGL